MVLCGFSQSPQENILVKPQMICYYTTLYGLNNEDTVKYPENKSVNNKQQS
jgi:hypothetical protein